MGGKEKGKDMGEHGREGEDSSETTRRSADTTANNIQKLTRHTKSF